jgi:hypothetical protein
MWYKDAALRTAYSVRIVTILEGRARYVRSPKNDHMRTRLSLVAAMSFLQTSAQPFGNYGMVLQEISPPDMPGVQSFAWGQHDGQWFIIGGRTDGLHRRQPPFAFLATGNNLSAYVVDPVTLQVWSASLASLPQSMEEQLQSTNMEFDQRDSILYCAGGYGYSPTALDHITFPNLTAIDLPGAMDAIRNAQPITPFFRQITDTRLEVTGGQLRMLDGHFYLVGGQRFNGRYNPMGPTSGPGFIQEYTNSVRRFSIDDDGVDLGLSDYWELVDTVNLHRRDYNMVPQVFPDGVEGLTVFTGVFQYVDDIPWLNTVDIRDTNITVVPVFEQLLNQYHSAHASLFEASTNTMRSVFFGGIGRYYYSGGTLMDDPNVPFVNTISLVERDGAGNMQETAIGSMPDLLGASAEFIPWPSTPQNASGILLQDQFLGDTVVLGHIVGGILSSAPNIFFINTGTQSSATDKVYRVLLVRTGLGAQDVTADLASMRLTVSGERLTIEFHLPLDAHAEMRLVDTTGRPIMDLGAQLSGDRQLTVDLRALSRGTYIVEVRGEKVRISERFVR